MVYHNILFIHSELSTIIHSELSTIIHDDNYGFKTCQKTKTMYTWPLNRSYIVHMSDNATDPYYF